MKVLSEIGAQSSNPDRLHRHAAHFVSSIVKHADSLAVISLLVYTVIWSTVLILMMNNFQIGIFDYGVAYNLLWRQAYFVPSYNSPFGVGYLSSVYYTKLISYLLVPIMWLFPSIYNLLIVQSLTFGLSGYILYLIAKQVLRRKDIALLIESMWLIYYPIAAANEFPFHYLTLLDPLYLLGFLTFLTNRRVASIVFFSLSAMTSLLAPVILIFTIPSLFLLRRLLFSEQTAKPMQSRRLLTGKLEQRLHLFLYLILMLIVALILLGVNYVYGGSGIFVSNAHASSGHDSMNALLNRLALGHYFQFWYLLFMVLPLAFLPLMNKYFLPPMIPPTLYYLFGYFPPLRFYFPMQYGALIAPQLFISMIISIRLLFIRPCKLPRLPRVIGIRTKSFKKSIGRDFNARRVMLLALITLNMVLASVYSPIGPLNPLLKYEINGNPPANGGYGVYSSLEQSQYNSYLSKMVSLIPNQDNVTVLSQFNMPQISGRDYFTFPGEFNPALPIDYAINDPHSAWFYVSTDDTGPDFHDYNMFELSNMFLENASYGVYGQSMGAILFKLHYSGTPVFYRPAEFSLHFNNSSSIGGSKSVLITPGTYCIRLISGSVSNATLFLGNVPLLNINSAVNSTNVIFPLYQYSNLKLTGSYRNAVISFTQIKYASHIALFPSIEQPSIFHTFTANDSYFNPVSSSIRNFDNESFSYIFEMNLTSYEYGGKNPIEAPNDAQVFALNGGALPYVWVQVENTGGLEYGFRNENGSISNYIIPAKIVTGRWFFVAATYEDGTADLCINGLLVYSGSLFPDNVNVGNPYSVEIGGAHPFLLDGNTFPNSNPLNASISDFVILNGVLSLGEIQNPYLLMNRLANNSQVVYSNWTNVNTYDGWLSDE